MFIKLRISCLFMYQDQLNYILNADHENQLEQIPNWLPSNIRDFKGNRVYIKFLCGDDVLKSIAIQECPESTQKCTSWDETEVL